MRQTISTLCVNLRSWMGHILSLTTKQLCPHPVTISDKLETRDAGDAAGSYTEQTTDKPVDGANEKTTSNIVNYLDDEMKITCDFTTFQPSRAGVQSDDYSPVVYAKAYFNHAVPTHDTYGPARRMLRSVMRSARKNTHGMNEVHTVKFHFGHRK